MIWLLRSLRSIETEYNFVLKASSTSGQDKLIPALWLATRAGNMAPSCPLGLRTVSRKQMVLFVPSNTPTLFGQHSNLANDLTLGQKPIYIKLHVSIFNILKHIFPTRADVDECVEEPDRCPVQSSSSCDNLIGSYHCNCLSGWRNEDSPTCMDINECSAGSYSCPANATCVNTLGSYQCQCNRCFYMSDNTCHRK